MIMSGFFEVDTNFRMSVVWKLVRGRRVGGRRVGKVRWDVDKTLHGTLLATN